MKHFLVLLTAVFMISFSGFAQGKIIQHTVSKDETIEQISKKYKITLADIYRLNPDSKKGIKPNMVLVIQQKWVAHTKPVSVAKMHVVVEKETLYSLSKMYNVSIENLQKANPDELKDGLKVGSVLQIPAEGMIVKNEWKPAVPEKTVAQSKPIDQQKPVALPKKQELITYEVKPKETFYSLTKKFNISLDSLMLLNPELKDGVKEAMILKLPATVVIKENSNKISTDLSKNVSVQDKKQLVLLLPFNISKIEKDTATTIANRLKADKFLNMTLDFYSGALIAIDSAKTLGLNIDVKILDSQETKNSSNVASLIQENGLQSAHAVIGPFYQANVEKAAEILSENKVPVISPLSKDLEKSFPNLLQSMPSLEMVKSAVFDYMHGKNGNILAILGTKKEASKAYLTKNHKDVKLVSLDEKGLVVSDSVVMKLVKNKMNYVILDTEKTGLILKTLDVLTSLMANYQIQLVILEKNETLDFEEIPLAKLAKLKMLYPSLTRSNETPEALIFEKAYKLKNKIFPNQYAVRGFDVTFDTMLRLSQETDFMKTIKETDSEQVGSKFQYEKKSEGFVNNGTYILYYDTDLSVKEAK
ncbi:MAG: LysM peptidoglycan-binding domain-containing protein [Flavobacterium sp.]